MDQMPSEGVKGLAGVSRGKAGAGMCSSLSSAHLGDAPPGGIFQNCWGALSLGFLHVWEFWSLGKGGAPTDSPK